VNDEQSLQDQIERISNKLDEAQHTIRDLQEELAAQELFLIQLTFFNEPAYIEQIRYRAKTLLNQMQNRKSNNVVQPTEYGG